ncbi:transglycosylase domain-containing protein [Algimonas porphyrae]|uniref:peptidoglycan glycosyltransferase n=1 Tax=Algimonas porphyrae TaxID=1128113 RepID=A0ABQ5UZF4_9PROT|nr:PBP1A family penicillin-binding protein [Algimonas porphyrae]GLQ19775.1 penicillin-binding protein [Algimonas porphyrae]
MRAALPTLPPRLLRFGRTLCLIGAGSAYLCGMLVLGAFAHVSADLPDPSRLWEQTRPPSIQIVDRQGRDLAVRGAHALEPLPVTALPVHLRQAVLATEDRRFHSHAGIDPYGLARATLANLRAGQIVEGGSTLTQQLTKNVFLTPEQTLERKAQEMIIAVWLERRFTKPELLRLYLSRVYFGSGAWGIEAATDHYFGRAPDRISLSEAALLAGLLKAPSALNPSYSPDRAATRMRTVLYAMDDQGLMADGVLEEALNTPVAVFGPRRSGDPDYFIDWIWPEIEAQVGVPNRDLVIQVTLDRDLQRVAEASLATRLDPARNASQGALVMLDGQGDVLAMVGGADYSASQFNRAVQAKRQPGSAFKPIVYLAGLRAGMNPWTASLDAPIDVNGWQPRNFKKEFAGPILLEDAMARSINTVSVRVLQEAGADAVADTAAQLGLDGLKPYASLALGAQGATVMDMAEAYLPFSTGGHAVPGVGVVSISTGDGTPLYDRPLPEPERRLGALEIRQMNRMLIHTVEAGTGRRAQVDGRMIAGKTGTTNDNRDAWFVGYAPDLTLAVWIGNDANQPMARITGGTIPAEIFGDVMSVALMDRPVAMLPQAERPDNPVPEVVEADTSFSALLDQLERATTQSQPTPLPTSRPTSGLIQGPTP